MAIDLDVANALDFLATQIDAGKCILFLGAGVHAPPPARSRFKYPAAQRPPIGSQLSRVLAEKLELKKKHPKEDVRNLQRVSLFFEIERSRAQLVEAVREAVQDGKKASPLLRALAEIGFPLVVTTNYDRLFEGQLERVDPPRSPRVSIYSPKSNEATEVFADPTAESPVMYKIHGDITRLDSIVITDEDYIQFVLRMRDKDQYDPVPLDLKFYLTRWTTLFVGYSLLDYNLRLLFKTLRWGTDPANIPDTYSLDFRPDPLIFDVWDNQRRYVKFIVQDSWSFIPMLYERVLGKELAP